MSQVLLYNSMLEELSLISTAASSKGGIFSAWQNLLQLSIGTKVF